VTISYDDFNVYRFTSEALYRFMLLNCASATLVQQATTATNTPHPKLGKALSMDPIDIFHREWSKSIKRDTNAYTICKEDHQWENWHREFTVTARSQQMDNILDDGYKPAVKSLDEAKFKQQQIYMYNVLNKTVKTNYGKEILRRHHNELNAQCVLTELRAHYKGSQAAVNETQQLFKYIITAKITNFSGSTQKFILHWFEQIRLYKTLTEEKKHLQPEQKLAMLQDAVSPSPALAAIEASHQQIMSVHPDREPTLDDYKALLLHTATQLSARAHGKPTSKARCIAYNTEKFNVPDDPPDEQEYQDPARIAPSIQSQSAWVL
jgi:hypothetical protein